MIKILVVAPKGKMDRLVVGCAARCEDIEVAGGVGPQGRDYIGADVGLAAGLGRELGAPVYDDLGEALVLSGANVVVDYSSAARADETVRACREHGAGLLMGTTGLSEATENLIAEAAADIPIVQAANTSYMVNVMYQLISEAAALLKGKCDIEIIDMHDHFKVDAPSGTAIEMRDAMAKAMGFADSQAEIAADSMERDCGTRASDIQFHSVRAGNIPSSHTVLFGGMGERIEISHHAYDWECYAQGAMDCIRFLSEKEAGLYSMEDVINSI